MIAVFIFALALMAAVLGSGIASRTPASVSVLLILAGIAAGPAGLGWIDWAPDDPRVEHLARWALVTVLYTDGMRIGLQQVRSAWHLPGRALLLGMPITFGVIAVLAHVLAGLPWLQALLLAAVLSPTDPVLATADHRAAGSADRLRRLLNVESGLNDGLALPLVLVLLSLLGDQEKTITRLLVEVAGGVALGLALPWPRAAAAARARAHPAEVPAALHGLGPRTAGVLGRLAVPSR